MKTLKNGVLILILSSVTGCGQQLVEFIDMAAGSDFGAGSGDLAGHDFAGQDLAVATDLNTNQPDLANVDGGIGDGFFPQPAINLRGIAPFGIASRAGMTSTGVTVVNGDVALYPNPTCTDATGGPGGSARAGGCAVHTLTPSATGLTVNGSIFFFGDPFDNGGTANSVVNDLNIAWTEGFNKVPTQPTIAAGELGGKTFLPGVYHNANLGLMAGGIAVMNAQNDLNAAFIFQVDTDLVDSGTKLLPSRIDLSNGAQAKNIWFVVGRDITIGHATTWNGTILAGRTATINDGSTVTGRVLAGADKSLPTGAITLVGAATSVTKITLP